MFTVIFRPEAEEDFCHAFEWYNEQVSGLGIEFFRCIDAAIAQIQRSPKQYPVVYKNLRRILIRRFPFGIFYFFEKGKIIVVAVFHARRNPKTLKNRKT